MDDDGISHVERQSDSTLRNVSCNVNGPVETKGLKRNVSSLLNTEAIDCSHNTDLSTPVSPAIASDLQGLFAK